MLLGANYHTPLPPGSLSKMLTAMIAVDWLQPGSQVPVSPSAAAVYPYRVGMSPGQVWPLDMTMHALLIDSANDAAYALAERISGTLGAFGATMKYAATEIGMRDRPVLHDPAGLDSTEGVGGGNLISAWDLAIAGRDMMANPYLAAIAGTRKYYFTAPDGVVTSLNNFNRYFLDWYPGAIGVKTGETDAAGFCVVEEAERGSRRMLAVVLDGENSYQTAGFLLDRGFATPVASERSDPTLPAVEEPYPAPKHPLLRQAALGDLTVAAADPPGVNRPKARDYEIGGATLGVVLAIAVGVLIWARRPRSIGAHHR